MLNNPEYCFACGTKNPFGLHLSFDCIGENRLQCKFKLSEEFQGYPGIAHGGIISTILDETMVQLLMAKKIIAVTGKLEVRFSQPVPINQNLVAESYFNKKNTSRWGNLIESVIMDSENNILAKGKGLFIDRSK